LKTIFKNNLSNTFLTKKTTENNFLFLFLKFSKTILKTKTEI